MRRLFAGGLLPRFRVTFTAGVQNHVPKASNELPKALLAVPDQARSRRRGVRKLAGAEIEDWLRRSAAPIRD